MQVILVDLCFVLNRESRFFFNATPASPASPDAARSPLWERWSLLWRVEECLDGSTRNEEPFIVYAIHMSRLEIFVGWHLDSTGLYAIG